MTDTIDITKLNKAAILAALYNNSKPLGLGKLHFNPRKMTIEEAEELLKEQTYFDYLYGRVMKVDFSKNQLYVGLYDRDNGQGKAAKIIQEIQ